MMPVARGAVAAIAAVASFFFVYWMGAALLSFVLPDAMVFALAPLVAVAAAAMIARFVWRSTAGPDTGLVGTIGKGAVSVGALGFVGGFFGPLVFTPEANQGPLLGLFITGPLGFVLGGIGGAVYWFWRGRDERA